MEKMIAKMKVRHCMREYNCSFNSGMSYCKEGGGFLARGALALYIQEMYAGVIK